MQGETPRHEPLPQRQGQAQQGKGAENQVQDHCLFRIVVVHAIVSELAAGRKGWITHAQGPLLHFVLAVVLVLVIHSRPVSDYEDEDEDEEPLAFPLDK